MFSGREYATLFLRPLSGGVGQAACSRSRLGLPLMETPEVWTSTHGPGLAHRKANPATRAVITRRHTPRQYGHQRVSPAMVQVRDIQTSAPIMLRRSLRRLAPPDLDTNSDDELLSVLPVAF